MARHAMLFVTGCLRVNAKRQCSIKLYCFALMLCLSVCETNGIFNNSDQSYNALVWLQILDRKSMESLAMADWFRLNATW